MCNKFKSPDTVTVIKVDSFALLGNVLRMMVEGH
jgi:hypothetical protein